MALIKPKYEAQWSINGVPISEMTEKEVQKKMDNSFISQLNEIYSAQKNNTVVSSKTWKEQYEGTWQDNNPDGFVQSSAAKSCATEFYTNNSLVREADFIDGAIFHIKQIMELYLKLNVIPDNDMFVIIEKIEELKNHRYYSSKQTLLLLNECMCDLAKIIEAKKEIDLGIHEYEFIDI